MPKKVKARSLDPVDVFMERVDEDFEQSNGADADRIVHGYKRKIHSPATGIRAHCVECMGGAVREVEECTNTTCSLYLFRKGTNLFDPRARKKRQ